MLFLRLRLKSRRSAGIAPLRLREMLREFRNAASSRKLIAGQVADLEAEGREGHSRATALHSRKQNRGHFDDLGSSRRDERQR